MKHFVIALSGVGRGSRGDLTNVEYKPIWNCHNESALHNENTLIKIKLKLKDFEEKSSEQVSRVSVSYLMQI
jgi:hypothetical protein